MMRYNSDIRRSHIKSLLVVSIIFLGCLYFGGGRADAITGANTFFPDSSTFGQGRSYTLVQVTGSDVRNSDGQLNAQTKMKARSTVANIYVPLSRVNSGGAVNLTILEACGLRNRDKDTSRGWTEFRVWNNTLRELRQDDDILVTLASKRSDRPTDCRADGSIDLSFTPTALNKDSAYYPAARTYHKGVEYAIYQFVADGFMNEAGSSYRYLNAFQLETSTPGALVGISDQPRVCDKQYFPISCPDTRAYTDPTTDIGGVESWVYSSFYGPSAFGRYNFRIDIESSCTSNGAISLYDVDASDGSLDQNLALSLSQRLPNGSEVPISFNVPGLGPQTVLPQQAFIDWERGYSINGIQVFGPHPDTADTNFGGNNNEYMDLPGGTPVLAALGTFEPEKTYVLKFTGISAGNAFQLLPYIDHCANPTDEDEPDQAMVCEDLDGRVIKGFPGTYKEVTFKARNNSGINWPADGNYEIGVVSTLRRLAIANFPDTRLPAPAPAPVGIGPPDHNSAEYIKDSTNGLNAEWISVDYERGGTDSTAERYVTTRAVNAGASRDFSVWVKIPESGKFNYGIRMLGRDSRFPGAWMDWDSSCSFVMEAVVLPPTCQASILSPRWTGQPFSTSVEIVNPNEESVTVTSASYEIDTATPLTGTVAVTSTNNSISANGGVRVYTSNNRSIQTPGTYTVTWTIDTEAENNTQCQSTVVIDEDPSLPASCSIPGGSITISPQKTFTVQFAVDNEGFSWPNGSETSGLHIGVATRGKTNWNSNWSVASPPPDANSDFDILASSGNQTIQNVTRYVPSVPDVDHRYFVNNPNTNEDTRIRLRAPVDTGDYTVVIRLYDRSNDSWFPSSCSFQVEVELEPLTCSFNPFEVGTNTPFEMQVTVLNPNLVPVVLRDSSYKISRNPNDVGLVASGQGEEKSLNSAVRTPFVPGTDAVPNASGGNNGSMVVYSPDDLRLVESGRYYTVWNVEYTNKGVVERPVGCDGSVYPATPGITNTNLPYAKLYGNDIFAGGGFGQQCELTASVAQPSAVGHLRIENAPQDGGSAYFQGASAELAVFAVGEIRGVLPGERRSVPSAMEEIRKLAFANSGSDVTVAPNSFTFGGGFNQTICTEDWWGNRDGDTSIVLANPEIDLASLNGSQQAYIIEASRLAGSPLSVFSSAAIEDGTRITLYVEGDVVIGSNGGSDNGIVYANESWTDTGRIPAVFVIAQGNIYVDHDIEELYGVYVAQPDPTDLEATGKIHTCYSYGLGDLVTAYTTGSDETASRFLAASCNRKLTVVGAFVANDIELLRTVGTLASAPRDEPQTSGNIAEVFQFNPLLYVSGGDGTPKTTREPTTVRYDSILSLPPSF